MKFLKYIQGNRKGKEAHRIEKHAMEDPFLFEAIEGYDSVPGNHADRIARMRSSITARSVHHKTKGAWKIAAATVGIIVASSAYFMLMNHRSSMLTAHENTNSQITLYIPEEYVEQKRLELMVIQEKDPQKKASLEGSVDNITNLDEVITSIEPMVIYMPQNYAQLQNKEIRELTKRSAETNHIEEVYNNREETKNSNDLVAQNEEIAESEEKNVESDTPPPSASSSSGSFMHQRPITIVMGANQSYAIKDKDLSSRSKSRSTKQASANKYAMAADEISRTNKPITLKGKVVDSNNEPLAGVSIAKKGTSFGTITDFNGEYSLEIDSADDITLTANLIGFEGIEIPNPAETQVIALKDDTQTLDEVVVTGYGVQRQRHLTGAIAAVSEKSLKKEKVIKPEPIIGNKEYNKYLEENKNKSVNNDCKEKKGEVVLQFSVDINGQPTNIQIEKSLCDSLDQEAIRLLKDGPKWKIGNTPGILKIKF